MKYSPVIPNDDSVAPRTPACTRSSTATTRGPPPPPPALRPRPDVSPATLPPGRPLRLRRRALPPPPSPPQRESLLAAAGLRDEPSSATTSQESLHHEGEEEGGRLLLELPELLQQRRGDRLPAAVGDEKGFFSFSFSPVSLLPPSPAPPLLLRCRGSSAQQFRVAGHGGRRELGAVGVSRTVSRGKVRRTGAREEEQGSSAAAAPGSSSAPAPAAAAGKSVAARGRDARRAPRCHNSGNSALAPLPPGTEVPLGKLAARSLATRGSCLSCCCFCRCHPRESGRRERSLPARVVPNLSFEPPPPPSGPLLEDRGQLCRRGAGERDGRRAGAPRPARGPKGPAPSGLRSRRRRGRRVEERRMRRRTPPARKPPGAAPLRPPRPAAAPATPRRCRGSRRQLPLLRASPAAAGCGSRSADPGPKTDRAAGPTETLPAAGEEADAEERRRRVRRRPRREQGAPKPRRPPGRRRASAAAAAARDDVDGEREADDGRRLPAWLPAEKASSGTHTSSSSAAASAAPCASLAAPRRASPSLRTLSLAARAQAAVQREPDVVQLEPVRERQGGGRDRPVDQAASSKKKGTAAASPAAAAPSPARRGRGKRGSSAPAADAGGGARRVPGPQLRRGAAEREELMAEKARRCQRAEAEGKGTGAKD